MGTPGGSSDYNTEHMNSDDTDSISWSSDVQAYANLISDTPGDTTPPAVQHASPGIARSVPFETNAERSTATSIPSQNCGGETANEGPASSSPSTARGFVHDSQRFNRLSRLQQIAAAHRLGRIETGSSARQFRPYIMSHTRLFALSGIANERIRHHPFRQFVAPRATEELRCQHHPPQDAEMCRVQTESEQNLRDLENIVRWTTEQAVQIAGSSSPRTQQLHPLYPHVNRSATDELQEHFNNIRPNLAQLQRQSIQQVQNLWSQYNRLQLVVHQLRRQDERLALRLARYRHAEPGDLPCLWVPHDPLLEDSQRSAMRRRQENYAREQARFRAGQQRQYAAMMMNQAQAFQRSRVASMGHDRHPLETQPHSMAPPQHGHPTVHAGIQPNSRLRIHMSQLQYRTNDPEEIPHSPESAGGLQSASHSGEGDGVIRPGDVSHDTREHPIGVTILGNGRQTRVQGGHAQDAFMPVPGGHRITGQGSSVASGAEAVTYNHAQARPRVYAVGDLHAMGARLQVDTGPSVRNSLRETGMFDFLSEPASSRHVSRELRSPQAEALRHVAWQGHSAPLGASHPARPSQGPSPGDFGTSNDPQTPASQTSNVASESRDDVWVESAFRANVQSRMQFPTQHYVQLRRHVT